MKEFHRWVEDMANSIVDTSYVSETPQAPKPKESKYKLKLYNDFYENHIVDCQTYYYDETCEEYEDAYDLN